jgi:hypothetical protein
LTPVRSREDLTELRLKYTEMLALRVENDAGAAQAQVRPRLIALAARFPGALREIDQLALGEIRRRIGALDVALGGGDLSEPWVDAMLLFHRFARGALWAKRWLGGRKSVDPEMRRSYVTDASSLGERAEEALSWSDCLADVARPPEGQITRLVYVRIASALGLTEREARSRVFGEAT